MVYIWKSTQKLIFDSFNNSIGKKYPFVIYSALKHLRLSPYVTKKTVNEPHCYVYRYIEPSYNTVVYTPLQVFVTIIIIFVHFSRDFWTFFCWLTFMQHENYVFLLIIEYSHSIKLVLLICTRTIIMIFVQIAIEFLFFLFC